MKANIIKLKEWFPLIKAIVVVVWVVVVGIAMFLAIYDDDMPRATFHLVLLTWSSLKDGGKE